MDDQTKDKTLTNGLGVDLISFGLTGLVGAFLITFIGLDGIVGQISVLVIMMIIGFILLRFDKLRQKLRSFLPVILTLLFTSIIINAGFALRYLENYQNKNYVSIDEIPSKISIYQGRDSNGNPGTAWLSIESRDSGERINVFNYSLPEQEYGSAGLVYRFFEPQDLTKYESIQIRAIFSAGAVCNFWLIDNNGNKREVKIGDGITPNGDIAINITEGIHTITIPLKSNFEPVEQKIVIQAEFAVDTYLSTGKNRFSIESVKFLTE